MLVGTAEVLVLPVTKGFEAQLKKDTEAGLTGFRRDAEVAGADAGANLRKGVKGETSKLSGDLEQAGASSGAGLRRGIKGETSKLSGDLESDGAKAGEGMSRGLSGGLGRLASVVSATGLPFGGLQSKLEGASKAADDTGRHSSGLVSSLDTLGGATVKIGGAVAVAGAAIAVHLGEGMQSADAKIASAAGTTVAAAEKVGAAFLDTGGKSEFSGQQMAQAFAPVAGQLKATQGRALDAAQATQVMTAASDLAAAKQIDLGDATSVVASTLQAFGLQAGDAAHVSDVLYSASNATGTSVDSLGGQITKLRSKLGDTAGSIGDMSGLLVDMTEHGITGRAAMSGLSSGMNTLLKPTAAAITTTKQLGLQVFDSQGKFVGLGSVIDQLAPRFARMTQQQQLAAATTLFGAGAARQMTAIINAGPAAYDRATLAVNRHGAAQSAAARQAATLHGEERTLGAEVTDLGAKIGTVLIPVVTAMAGALLKATTFVTSHKAALIALAAVVTGVLGTAIAVFTVNKMAQFGQSFVTASGHVKAFASDVQSAVSKVIGLFTQQTEAAQTSSAKIGTAAQATSAAVEDEAASIEGSNSAIDDSNATTAGSFSTVGNRAETTQGKVAGSETAMASEVTAADSTIEAENTAAGLSFTRLLGPIGAVASALAALDISNPAKASQGIPGNPNSNITSGVNPTPSPTGGINLPNPFGGKIHIGIGAAGGYVTKPTLAIIGEAGPEFLIPEHQLAEVAQQGTPLPALPGSLGLGTEKASATGAGTVKVEHSGTVNLSADFTQQLAKATTAADNGANQNVAADQALTPNEIRAVAYAAGFRGSALDKAVQIAEAESGGVPGPSDRYNPGPQEDSRGLWQENVAASANPEYRNTNLYDPLTAAKVAYAQSDHGTDFNPWTTYTSGKYLSEPTGTGAGTPMRGSASAREKAAGTAAIPAGVTAMLKTAEALIGTQYTHGGGHGSTFDPVDELKKIGVDCSGFVSAVLHGGGVGSVPTTTQGTAGIKGMAPGKGKYVTVYDRNTGPVDQEHEFINILGKWFMSGGNSAANPGSRVRQLTNAQAQIELAGGGFRTYHPTGPLNTGGAFAGVPGVQDKQVTAASNELQKMIAAVSAGTVKSLSGTLTDKEAAGIEKTEQALVKEHSSQLTQLSKALVSVHTDALNELVQKQVASEKTSTAKKIAAEQKSTVQTPFLTSIGVTAASKATVNAEVAQQRESLAVQVDSQRASAVAQNAAVKAAASTQTRQQKAALDRQTSDTKTGTSLLSKMVTAVHSGSLKSLQTALEAAHNAGLSKITGRLDHDHSAALAALSKELVAVHKEAMDSVTKQLAAAKNQPAAPPDTTATGEDPAATALTKASTLLADDAKAKSDLIADSSKVSLDQQAQAGLTGTALTAAVAQTSLDQITQSNNQAIDAAQKQVDNASDGSALAQAQAANVLAGAQAAATVQQAEAQAVLDKANAAATAAGAAPAAPAGAGAAPSFSFQIFGNGALTEAQLFSEVKWALSTGRLPVAPPVPAPAAA